MALIRWAHRAQGLATRGFPFMIRRSTRTPMGRLRAMARAEWFARLPLGQRWFLWLGMTVAWPLGALLQTARQLRMDPLRQQPRLARLRHGARMLTMALLHNVPPLEFSAYRLWEPGRRALAGDFLYWPELGVLNALNRHRGAVQDDVQDKARFAELCTTHGLPCIPTLAVFTQGRQPVPAAPFVPDQARLWVKDLAGSQGSGAEHWQLHAGQYQDRQGRRLTPVGLAERWQGQDCIVQPWVPNHPELAALSNGPLLAVRIITGLDRTGQVHIIATLLALPWGRPGERQPKILCAIDTATGRLTRALLAGTTPVAVHPDSNAPLVDTLIPHWPSCLELVQRAHAGAFDRFVFLGWDVAVTDDGPLLIEANTGWGALHHQRLDGRPLGDTPFATIALEQLEHAACD
ncbi:hypothetical protein LZ023_32515 [Pseudomonas silvicola]|nr:hypothetical protein LZ023_32515 [Pseudomonas silvicola]